MKKGLLFGGVVLAVIGVGYFIYKKNSKKQEIKKISTNVKKLVDAKRKKLSSAEIEK